ncbi:hypothetical protein DFH08DRAFT_960891 [Mycena albidolilacea]|uniref:DUF6534 domain-containing protein n=1 Tax=Mycena albidolilacea TaxID=1033008 RepID=A0AAD7ESY7_9AGAR|nr:hypothetical protein DFH08DRAFT_960891 [Mycena albidolilacea]
MSTRLTSAQTTVLGGWDLTIYAALYLQGVLCGQFAQYTNLNKRDSVWLKIFVAGLALFTMLKMLQVSAVNWLQNVTLAGNTGAASSLWVRHWVPKLNPIFDAVIGIIVQSFFCRRLWAISRNIYIVIACMASFTLALISGGVAAANLLRTNSFSHPKPPWMPAHLVAAMCGDFLLTGSTAFYLLRHRKTVLPRGPTAPILNSLLRSAAPVALVRLIATVTMLMLRHKNPGTFVRILSASAVTLLPQLYVWSAMWTLNSREDIYLAADSDRYTLHPELRETETPVQLNTGGRKIVDSQGVTG